MRGTIRGRSSDRHATATFFSHLLAHACTQ